MKYRNRERLFPVLPIIIKKNNPDRPILDFFWHVTVNTHILYNRISRMLSFIDVSLHGMSGGNPIKTCDLMYHPMKMVIVRHMLWEIWNARKGCNRICHIIIYSWYKVTAFFTHTQAKIESSKFILYHSKTKPENLVLFILPQKVNKWTSRLEIVPRSSYWY
jgi:hypothetical protein